MGTDQNTRAYRRRLNVVANKFRRTNATDAEPQFAQPSVAIRIAARTAMWFRVYWKSLALVLWCAVVGAIGVLAQCRIP